MERSFFRSGIVAAALLGMVGCSDEKSQKPVQPVTEPQTDQATQVRKAIEKEKPRVPQPEAFDLVAQSATNGAKEPLVIDPEHLVEPPRPKEEPLPEVAPLKKEPKRESIPEEKSSKKDDITVKESVQKTQKQKKKREKHQETSAESSDTDFDPIIRKRIDELKELQPGAPCVQWLEQYGATQVIGDSILKKKKNSRLSKLSEGDIKYFRSTMGEFIAANVKTFLPLIKDYSVEKVSLLRETKRLKNFALSMSENNTKEIINVEVLTTKSDLRIVNVVVKETSLQSIFQTSATDIFQSPNPRQAWDRFLKGGRDAS